MVLSTCRELSEYKYTPDDQQIREGVCGRIREFLSDSHLAITLFCRVSYCTLISRFFFVSKHVKKSYSACVTFPNFVLITHAFKLSRSKHMAAVICADHTKCSHQIRRYNNSPSISGC